MVFSFYVNREKIREIRENACRKSCTSFHKKKTNHELLVSQILSKYFFYKNEKLDNVLIGFDENNKKLPQSALVY